MPFRFLFCLAHLGSRFSDSLHCGGCSRKSGHLLTFLLSIHIPHLEKRDPPSQGTCGQHNRFSKSEVILRNLFLSGSNPSGSGIVLDYVEPWAQGVNFMKKLLAVPEDSW